MISKNFLKESILILIIFFVSILFFVLRDDLNIHRPTFIYEAFLVIPITFLFGKHIGTIFLLFVLTFDSINHVGLTYFHSLIDVYTNLYFFVSHSYFLYYVFYQIILISLCFLFFKLVNGVRLKRLKILSIFFLSFVAIIFTADNYLSKKSWFQNVLESNDIFITDLKNIGNFLTIPMLREALEINSLNKKIGLIGLDDSKTFFYPNLKIEQADFHEKKKNVVLIIVESFGYINDVEILDFVLEPFQNERLKEKFHVSIKELEANDGSTVTAEFRELCGVYKSNFRHLEEDLRCAPTFFNDLGYKTISAHPYKGGYFNRRIWWKSIGFEEIIFMNTIDDQKNDECVGSYYSYCDNQFFKKILSNANDRKKPYFLYYLSVEGHLPTKTPSKKEIEECLSVIKANDALCGNLSVNKSFLEAIVNSIIELNIKDTDFYIVGDHIPSSLFIKDLIMESNDVPAISLKSK